MLVKQKPDRSAHVTAHAPRRKAASSFTKSKPKHSEWAEERASERPTCGGSRLKCLKPLAFNFRRILEGIRQLDSSCHLVFTRQQLARSHSSRRQTHACESCTPKPINHNMLSLRLRLALITSANTTCSTRLGAGMPGVVGGEQAGG